MSGNFSLPGEWSPGMIYCIFTKFGLMVQAMFILVQKHSHRCRLVTLLRPVKLRKQKPTEIVDSSQTEIVYVL